MERRRELLFSFLRIMKPLTLYFPSLSLFLQTKQHLRFPKDLYEKPKPNQNRQNGYQINERKERKRSGDAF